MPGDKDIIGAYKLLQTLGQGSFGKVKKAIHLETQEVYAIKIIEKKRLNRKAQEKINREIRILKMLKHPFIVRLYEIIDTPRCIYLVMEYVVGGELFDYIVAHQRVKEKEARIFFAQIVLGVEYCHSKNVVHRDLKPENLLIDSNHNIKIIDFGLSNVLDPDSFLRSKCGSPHYTAPEVTERMNYGTEADVFSMGVILFALLCGYLPFDDPNHEVIARDIRAENFEMPSHVSRGAVSLIKSMLRADARRRITLQQIKTHHWLEVARVKIPSMNPDPPIFSSRLTSIKEESETGKAPVGAADGEGEGDKGGKRKHFFAPLPRSLVNAIQRVIKKDKDEEDGDADGNGGAQENKQVTDDSVVKTKGKTKAVAKEEVKVKEKEKDESAPCTPDQSTMTTPTINTIKPDGTVSSASALTLENAATSTAPTSPIFSTGPQSHSQSRLRTGSGSGRNSSVRFARGQGGGDGDYDRVGSDASLNPGSVSKSRPLISPKHSKGQSSMQFKEGRRMSLPVLVVKPPTDSGKLNSSMNMHGHGKPPSSRFGNRAPSDRGTTPTSPPFESQNVTSSSSSTLAPFSVQTPSRNSPSPISHISGGIQQRRQSVAWMPSQAGAGAGNAGTPGLGQGEGYFTRRSGSQRRLQQLKEDAAMDRGVPPVGGTTHNPNSPTHAHTPLDPNASVGSGSGSGSSLIAGTAHNAGTTPMPTPVPVPVGRRGRRASVAVSDWATGERMQAKARLKEAAQARGSATGNTPDGINTTLTQTQNGGTAGGSEGKGADKDKDGTSMYHPRSGAFNRSATSSKPPAEIVKDLESVLAAAGVECKRKTEWRFKCKYWSSEEAARLAKQVRIEPDMRFEMEVFKLPRLPLHVVIYRRVQGNTWAHKDNCAKLLSALHL